MINKNISSFISFPICNFKFISTTSAEREKPEIFQTLIYVYLFDSQSNFVSVVNNSPLFRGTVRVLFTTIYDKYTSTNINVYDQVFLFSLQANQIRKEDPKSVTFSDAFSYIVLRVNKLKLSIFE